MCGRLWGWGIRRSQTRSSSDNSGAIVKLVSEPLRVPTYDTV